MIYDFVMKKELSFIVLFIFALSLFSPMVFAEDSTTNSETDYAPSDRRMLKNRIENAQENFQLRMEKYDESSEKMEQRKAKIIIRCEAIEKKVNARFEKFLNNRQNHVNAYYKIDERLGNIIYELSEKGFDTSELEQALLTLQTLIADYRYLAGIFAEQLSILPEIDCTNPDGEYKKALTSLKNSHQEMVAKRKEIRAFYASDIRDAIKELRSQAEELRNSGDTNEE